MLRGLVTAVVVALALLCTGCSDLPPDEASVLPEQPLALVAPAADETKSDVDRLDDRDLAGLASATEQAEVTSAPEPAPSELVVEAVADLDSAAETQVAVVPEGTASILVRVAPSEAAASLITLDRVDEFGQVRVFRVLAERGSFYEVQVPMRPNGSVGYLHRDDVDVTTTDQRILIDLSDRAVTVWNGPEVVFEAIGTIGDQRTPTPIGDFYVRNVFPWYADSVYGPWVIPLSAYSEAIDQINGGDAVVAIHGTQRPDLVGAAASLGCFRLENGVLSDLAELIEPGAPVAIVP